MGRFAQLLDGQEVKPVVPAPQRPSRVTGLLAKTQAPQPTPSAAPAGGGPPRQGSSSSPATPEPRSRVSHLLEQAPVPADKPPIPDDVEPRAQAIRDEAGTPEVVETRKKLSSERAAQWMPLGMVPTAKTKQLDKQIKKLNATDKRIRKEVVDPSRKNIWKDVDAEKESIRQEYGSREKQLRSKKSAIFGTNAPIDPKHVRSADEENELFDIDQRYFSADLKGLVKDAQVHQAAGVRPDIKTSFKKLIKGREGMEKLPFSIAGLEKMIELNAIAGKVKTGGQLSEYEQSRLQAFMADKELKAELGQTVGSGIFEGIVDMIPYAAEFVSTGGLAATARGGVQAGLGKLGRAGSNKAVQVLGGGLAAGTARTLMEGHKLAEGTLERMLPDVKFDEGYTHISKPGKEVLPAFMNSFGDLLAENVSEESGDLIVGLFSRLGKPAANKVAQTALYKAWRKINPKAPKGKFVKTMNKLGKTGIVGESVEERYGAVLRELMGVDKDQHGDTGLLERVFWSNAEQFLIESGVLAVGGGPATVGGWMDGARRADRYAAAQDVRSARRSFFQEMDALGVTQDREIVKQWLDPTVSPEEKVAALGDLLAAKGQAAAFTEEEMLQAAAAAADASPMATVEDFDAQGNIEMEVRELMRSGMSEQEARDQAEPLEDYEQAALEAYQADNPNEFNLLQTQLGDNPRAIMIEAGVYPEDPAIEEERMAIEAEDSAEVPAFDPLDALQGDVAADDMNRAIIEAAADGRVVDAIPEESGAGPAKAPVETQSQPDDNSSITQSQPDVNPEVDTPVDVDTVQIRRGKKMLSFKKDGGIWVNTQNGEPTANLPLIKQLEDIAANGPIDYEAQDAEKARKKQVEQEITRMIDEDPILSVVRDNGGIRMPARGAFERFADEYALIPKRWRATGKAGKFGQALDQMVGEIWPDAVEMTDRKLEDEIVEALVEHEFRARALREGREQTENEHYEAIARRQKQGAQGPDSQLDDLFDDSADDLPALFNNVKPVPERKDKPKAKVPPKKSQKKAEARGLKVEVDESNTEQFKKPAVEAYLKELRRLGKMEVAFPDQLARDIEKYTGERIHFDADFVYLKKPTAAAQPETSAPAKSPVRVDLEKTFTNRDDDFWGLVDSDDGSEFAESGYSGTQCTGFACAIAHKLGQDRVRIFGFAADENLDSEIGALAGGHDFAVVDGRYIVDPWTVEVESIPGASVVLDLEADKGAVQKLYGSRENWEDMTERLLGSESPADIVDTVALSELQTGAMQPTLKAAATKGESPVWFTQSDGFTIQMDAKKNFGVEPSDYAKAKAAEYQAATAAGYELTHYRISGLQNIKVFQKNGRILTQTGAEALVDGGKTVQQQPIEQQGVDGKSEQQQDSKRTAAGQQPDSKQIAELTADQTADPIAELTAEQKAEQIAEYEGREWAATRELVEQWRKDRPLPLFENEFKDNDTDRGYARYIDKYFNDLPVYLQEWWMKRPDYTDQETGERVSVVEHGVRGTHVYNEREELSRAEADAFEKQAPKEDRAERRDAERKDEDAELDALWGDLRKLRSRMNLGVDPDVAVLGTKIAAVYIKKGARNFRDFAASAQEKLGEDWDAFKDYLLSFWQGASVLPDFAKFQDEIEDLTRAQAARIVKTVESAAPVEAKKEEKTDAAAAASVVGFHGSWASDLEELTLDTERGFPVLYFSSSEAVASTYIEGSGKVYRRNLEAQNVKTIDAAGATWDDFHPFSKISEAYEAGHDMLIIRNLRDDASGAGDEADLYAVFSKDVVRVGESKAPVVPSEQESSEKSPPAVLPGGIVAGPEVQKGLLLVRGRYSVPSLLNEYDYPTFAHNESPWTAYPELVARVDLLFPGGAPAMAADWGPRSMVEYISSTEGDKLSLGGASVAQYWDAVFLSESAVLSAGFRLAELVKKPSTDRKRFNATKKYFGGVHLPATQKGIVEFLKREFNKREAARQAADDGKGKAAADLFTGQQQKPPPVSVRIHGEGITVHTGVAPMALRLYKNGETGELGWFDSQMRNSMPPGNWKPEKNEGHSLPEGWRRKRKQVGDDHWEELVKAKVPAKKSLRAKAKSVDSNQEESDANGNRNPDRGNNLLDQTPGVAGGRESGTPGDLFDLAGTAQEPTGRDGNAGNGSGLFDDLGAKPADARSGSAGADADRLPGNKQSGPLEESLVDEESDEVAAIQEDVSAHLDPADRNHRIDADDKLFTRGDAAKVKANIKAIKLLRKLEEKDRNPSPNEKKTLAQYVGWGGLPNVFDTDQANTYRWQKDRPYIDSSLKRWGEKWFDLHEEIKELMSEEEFAAAARSTLNAHYTAGEVIASMWGLAERLGFKGGRVGEFGAGVGHFIGLQPEALANKSNWTGVELDSLTGRILKKLYPQANVKVSGLQDVNIPSNSLSMVIGNFPFHQDGPYDKRYPKLSLHNYFFVRALDAVKPGGLVISVTSTGTMDTLGRTGRQLMAEKADLVGAIRLPNNAFKANAGTDVTTDIVIFRKKDGHPFPHAHPFVEVGKVAGSIPANEYFEAHPEMMLGIPKLGTNMYGNERFELHPDKTTNLGERLAAAIESLPANIAGSVRETHTDNWKPGTGESSSGKEHSYQLGKDGAVYQVAGGELVKPDWENNPKLARGQRAKAYIKLRELVKSLIALETDANADSAAIERTRTELNRVYDAYLNKHKALTNQATHSYLHDDPEFQLVAAIEEIEYKIKLTKDGKRGLGRYSRKGQIFSKRVQYPWAEPSEASDLSDAADISVAYRNHLSIPFMAELLNKTPEQVRSEALQSPNFFENPESGAIEERSEYLSGNVRHKLYVAEQEALTNPDMQRNVEALKEAQPRDLGIDEIDFTLGGSWIPEEVVNAWMREQFGAGHASFLRSDNPNVHDRWEVTLNGDYPDWSTADVSPDRMIQAALNLTRVTVERPHPEDRKKRVRDPEATLAAADMQSKLKKAFVKYAKGNEKHGASLAKAYNAAHNNHVDRDWTVPDRFQVYPGAAAEVDGRPFLLRKHQRRAVARILQEPVLLAHGVGTGKTAVMVTAAMEMRRIGTAKKPLIVVQNATLEQFGSFIPKLYPGARVLVAAKKDLEKKNRQRFMGRIATGEYDAVVMSHSQFDRLPDDPQRVSTRIREQLSELESAIREQKDRDGKKANVKDLESAKSRLEERLKKLLDRAQDDTVYFEQLGIDAVMMDEAHLYKKNFFITKKQRMKGLDTGSSQKSLSLSLKLEHIREKTGGKNVVMATGTPVTNTLTEIWNMMRYIAPEKMQQWNIGKFDDFASTFTDAVLGLEVDAAGRFKMVERFASYMNVPELSTLFKQVADVVFAEDLDDVKRPPLKGGKPTALKLDRNAALESYTGYLQQLYEWFEGLDGQQRKEFSYIPLVIFGRARKSTIDMRLIDETLPPDENSKLMRAATEIYERYKLTAADKGTQLAFLDTYRNLKNKKEVFNAWQALKAELVARGIPEDQVAVISDYNTDPRRERLFTEVNEGKIRVLIGSTEKMGIGVNVQERLAVLHHVDAPFRPADMEQREGRILRQGNMFGEEDMVKQYGGIEIVRYGVEKTLDAGMYQMLERKQKFINQALKGQTERTVSDDDDSEVSFAQASAMFSGDPSAMRRVVVDVRLKELRGLENEHQRKKTKLRDDIRWQERQSEQYQAYKDIIDSQAAEFKPDDEHFQQTSKAHWEIEVKGKTYSGRAGEVEKPLDKLIKSALNSMASQVTSWNKADRRDISGSPTPLKINGHDMVMVPWALMQADGKLKESGVQIQSKASYELNEANKAFYFHALADGLSAASGSGTLMGYRSYVKRVVERATAEQQMEAVRKNKLVEQRASLDLPYEYAQEVGELQIELAALETELKASGGGADKPASSGAQPNWEHDGRIDDATAIEWAESDDEEDSDTVNEGQAEYRAESGKRVKVPLKRGKKGADREAAKPQGGALSGDSRADFNTRLSVAPSVNPESEALRALLDRGEIEYSDYLGRIFEINNQTFPRKTLVSKDDTSEYSNSRLMIGVQTTESGNRRIVVSKTSEDGMKSRGVVAYLNLYTDKVSLSEATDLYPDVDFEEEMRMYAADPAGYESLFDEDLTRPIETARLIEAISDEEKANKGQARTVLSLGEKQPSLEGRKDGSTSGGDVNENQLVYDRRPRLDNPAQKEFNFDYERREEKLTKEQQVNQADAERGSSQTLRWAAGTILGNAIASDFRKTGKASLIGQMITSAADLAVAGQVFRNPSFETMRYFFVRKGQVVHETGATSRLPGSSRAFAAKSEVGYTGAGDEWIKMLKETAARVGADGIWFLHNHPSGDVAASKQDVYMTSAYTRELGGLVKGHVVINHKKYGFIPAVSDLTPSAMRDILIADPQDLPAVDGLQNQYTGKLAKVPHKLLGETILSGAELAKIGKRKELLNASGDTFQLVGTTPAGEITGIMSVPVGVVSGRSDVRLLALARQFQRNTGSGRLFAANVPAAIAERFVKGVRTGLFTDVVLSGEYDSMRDKGVNPRTGYVDGSNMHRSYVAESQGNYLTASQTEDLIKRLKSATRERDTVVEKLETEKKVGKYRLKKLRKQAAESKKEAVSAEREKKKESLAALRDRYNAKIDELKEAVKLGKRKLRDELKDQRGDINSKIRIIETYISEKTPAGSSDIMRIAAGESRKVLKKVLGAAKSETRQKYLDEAVHRIDVIFEDAERRDFVKYIDDILLNREPVVGKNKVLAGSLMPDQHETLAAIREAWKVRSGWKNLELIDDLKGELEGVHRLLVTAEGLEPEMIKKQEALANKLQTRIWAYETFGDINGGTRQLSDVIAASKELTTLIEDGRALHQIAQQIFRQERDDYRDQAHMTFTGGQGIATSAISRRERSYDDRLNPFKALDTFDTMHQSWEWFLDKLSKFDKTTGILGGRLVRKFALEAHKATTKEDAGVRNYQELFHDKLVEIYGTKRRGKLAHILAENSHRVKNSGVFLYTDEGKEAEFPLSKNEAYKYWQLWQDETLRKTLTDTTHVSSDTIKQIEEFIGPEVLAWAKWQLEEFYPNYYQTINPIYKQLWYVNMPYHDNYSPVYRHITGRTRDDMDAAQQQQAKASILNMSLKARVENMKDFETIDGDTVLYMHVMNMEHFKAWALPMRLMNGVFRGSEVQEAIQQYHGKAAKHIMNRFLDDFVRGGVDNMMLMRGVDRFRAKYTKAVIGAKFPIFLKQLASIPAYAMDIPLAAFAKGEAAFWRNPSRAFKILMQSDMMKDRYKKGHSRDVILALQSSKAPAIKSLAGKRTWADKLMVLTQLGDGMAIVVGGYAAYHYHYNKARSNGANHQTAHNKALQEFELLTARTQQAGNVKDLGHLQRGGSVMKLFTMFSTSPISYYRSVSGAVRNAAHGRGSKNEAMKRVIIGHFLLPMLFQFIANGFRWDDEDQLRAAILGSFNKLFIAGEVADALIAAIVSNDIRRASGLSQTPYGDVAQDVVYAVGRLDRELERGTFDSSDMLFVADKIASASSKGLGVPYDGARNWISGASEAALGDTDMPIRRMLGYTDFALDSDSEEDDAPVSRRSGRRRRAPVPRSRR